MGIPPENFLVVLHNRIYKNNLNKALDICYKEDVRPRVIWQGEFNVYSKWEQVQSLIQKIPHKNYILYAETDEFHEYEMPLNELIYECSRNHWWIVRGKFVDRLSEDGGLNPIEENPSLFKQFPIKCDSSNIWNGGGNALFKVMLFKPNVKLTSGAHQPSGFIIQDKVHPRLQKVHHFRWTNSTRVKYERRKQYVSGHSNANPIVEYLNNNDKIKLEDVNIV